MPRSKKNTKAVKPSLPKLLATYFDEGKFGITSDTLAFPRLLPNDPENGDRINIDKIIKELDDIDRSSEEEYTTSYIDPIMYEKLDYWNDTSTPSTSSCVDNVTSQVQPMELESDEDSSTQLPEGDNVILQMLTKGPESEASLLLESAQRFGMVIMENIVFSGDFNDKS